MLGLTTMGRPARELERELKERLGLAFRAPPELVEKSATATFASHADAIRLALDELRLSAIFCVQGVPAAALLRVDEYDAKSTMEVHAALWNQGLATILVVVDNAYTIRVFSLGRVPTRQSVEEFETRALVTMLNAAIQTAEAQSLFTSLESGRFVNEHRSYFKPNEAIDAVLLDNLRSYSHLLRRNGRTEAAAEALLLQTMFVAYLEDREIIGAAYLRDASSYAYSSFHDLLASGNQSAFLALFEALARDFNGDLFLTPESIHGADLNFPLDTDDMRQLADFRSGKLHKSTGQWQFWGYNFRYIPVELISAVYDRFISEDSKRKDYGSYYTPMFLVDTVVSNLWDYIDADKTSKAKFLDPACGSGIFLVSIFQRLCSEWRAQHNKTTIPWTTLVGMLLRLNGWDVNGGAIRVALFSMYLALLEEVTPPDLRLLIESHRGLPDLLGSNLRERDFFDAHEAVSEFDYIVGNPPWTSRRAAHRTSIEWCRRRGLPMPSQEDAWAFVWKSFEHLDEGGLVAFLLPAMGFLQSTDTTRDARHRLFSEHKVVRVLNLSDLRFLLFETAIRPTSLFIIGPKAKPSSSYTFDYWSPKADLNTLLKRAITLSTADRATVKAGDVIQNPLILKQRSWMNEPEGRLFRYLSSLPKLGRRTMPYRASPTSFEVAESGLWIIGQGYQPALPDRVTERRYRAAESDYVGTLPDLPISQFTRFWCSAAGLQRADIRLVRRRGFEPGFVGPRILIPRGVNTAKMRLRAAFAEDPFTAQDIFQVIRVPDAQVNDAKLFTAILNSKLALWFAFHGTASFGTERPEVKAGELLSFPFPEPRDLPDSVRSESAKSELIEIVDHARLSTGDFVDQEALDSDRLPRVDRLVYDYFGLSDEEILLVEDGIDFEISSAQPSRGSRRRTWQASSQHDRRRYADVLASALRTWFAPDTAFFIATEAHNKDVAILSICVIQGQSKGFYIERDSNDLWSELDRIGDAAKIALSKNVYLSPDIRLFKDSCAYLVKPAQFRFWTASQALADADAIANDIQTSIAMQAQSS